MLPPTAQKAKSVSWYEVCLSPRAGMQQMTRRFFVLAKLLRSHERFARPEKGAREKCCELVA